MATLTPEYRSSATANIGAPCCTRSAIVTAGDELDVSDRFRVVNRAGIVSPSGSTVAAVTGIAGLC